MGVVSRDKGQRGNDDLIASGWRRGVIGRVRWRPANRTLSISEISQLLNQRSSFICRDKLRIQLRNALFERAQIASEPHLFFPPRHRGKNNTTSKNCFMPDCWDEPQIQAARRLGKSKREQRYGVPRQAKPRRRFGPVLCRIHLKTSLSNQSGVALRLPPHSIKVPERDRQF